MKLSTLQAGFYAQLTSPSCSPIPCLHSARGDAEAGLAIYREMFVWRQVDAIREEFPKLRTVLGEETFFELCTEYLQAHPSEHPDLTSVGRRLPQYLALHANRLPRPDAVELAQLEWARSEVFFENRVAPVGPASLALSPDEVARARLVFIEAFRFLRLSYDAAGVWAALDESERIPPPTLKQSAVAVWRPQFDVFHTELANDEAEALSRALAGGTLAHVCEAFADAANPITSAFEALDGWISEGWVAEVSTQNR